jgi:hypothetical protein
MIARRQISEQSPSNPEIPVLKKSLADLLAVLCAQSFRSSLPAEATFLAGEAR